jgi:hypothetical protein
MCCFVSAQRFGGENGDDGAFVSSFKAAIIALGKHVQVFYLAFFDFLLHSLLVTAECRNFMEMGLCGIPEGHLCLFDNHVCTELRIVCDRTEIETKANRQETQVH